MVTIQDVAKQAGVPVKTASRALAGLTQGRRRDAKERAERVLKAAEELGYQPSNVAQSLRRGKTSTIGMVVGGLSNKYFGDIIEAFCDELGKYDYRLLLEVTKWDKKKEHECLKGLLRHRVDGIIYLCDLPEKVSREHRMMLDHGFPLMTIVANDYGFGMVKNDFTKAIASAIKLLHQKGNTDVGLVIPYGHRAQEVEMKAAFESACTVFGVNAFTYILKRGNCIKEAYAMRHQAWLVDGFYTLKQFEDNIAKNETKYSPYVIGFYDHFNWDNHSENICGAIIRQTGKIIKTTVKEIIARIENKSAIKRDNVIFSAEFVAKNDFDKLKFRKLPRDYSY